jgi:hypothetical protein
MLRIRNCLFAALLGLGVTLGVHAGALDAPGTDLQISLITYGPGEVYWERFGHDVIRIRDRVSGESGDFSYGVFDPEEKDFNWNFVRGRMRYMIDAEASPIAQQYYTDVGRSVLEQRLDLSAAQAAALRAFLVWNLQPEHQSYDYDYFTRNCTTQIRDALNMVLGNALQPALTARPAPMTYRQQMDRLMRPQPLLMLAMDLVLGRTGDRPLNEWQESFIPMVLAREIRSVRIPDNLGGLKPLVLDEKELAPNRLNPPGDLPPSLPLPFGLGGLGLAAAMLVSRSRLPALYASVATVYLLSAGLVGTVLLALWTLTTHRATWANENLLLFNPFAFAMISAVWRSKRGLGVGLLAQILITCQLGCLLVAVLLHFLPGASQKNLPWQLFATPIWLAIAVGLCASRDLVSLRRFPA